jgi:hypothetical protein
MHFNQNEKDKGPWPFRNNTNFTVTAVLLLVGIIVALLKWASKG